MGGVASTVPDAAAMLPDLVVAERWSCAVCGPCFCARCWRHGLRHRRPMWCAPTTSPPSWWPSAARCSPASSLQIGLRLQHIPKWHTYWRNPGDSGLPTMIDWQLPAGASVGEIEWPAPKRLPIGPLVNYGYEGELLLPLRFTAPADARPGSELRLRAKADWLVCHDVCIPESATLELLLPVVAADTTPGSTAWTAQFEQRRRAARAAAAGLDGGAAAPRPRAAADAGIRHAARRRCAAAGGGGVPLHRTADRDRLPRALRHAARLCAEAAAAGRRRAAGRAAGRGRGPGRQRRGVGQRRPDGRVQRAAARGAAHRAARRRAPPRRHAAGRRRVGLGRAGHRPVDGAAAGLRRRHGAEPDALRVPGAVDQAAQPGASRNPVAPRCAPMRWPMAAAWCSASWRWRWG